MSKRRGQVNAASNTFDCFRDCLGLKVVAVLKDTLPNGWIDLASGTKTLVFDDGTGLTITRHGTFWRESKDEIKRAIERRREEVSALCSPECQADFESPSATAPRPAGEPQAWTREQVQGQINQELCGYYREDTVAMLEAYAETLPPSAAVSRPVQGPEPPIDFSPLAETANALRLKAELEGLRQVVAECEPFLKDGESPAACIERNRKDIDTLLGELAKAKEAARSPGTR